MFVASGSKEEVELWAGMVALVSRASDEFRIPEDVPSAVFVPACGSMVGLSGASAPGGGVPVGAGARNSRLGNLGDVSRDPCLPDCVAGELA